MTFYGAYEKVRSGEKESPSEGLRMRKERQREKKETKWEHVKLSIPSAKELLFSYLPR